MQASTLEYMAGGKTNKYNAASACEAVQGRYLWVPLSESERDHVEAIAKEEFNEFEVWLGIECLTSGITCGPGDFTRDRPSASGALVLSGDSGNYIGNFDITSLDNEEPCVRDEGSWKDIQCTNSFWAVCQRVIGSSSLNCSEANSSGIMTRSCVACPDISDAASCFTLSTPCGTLESSGYICQCSGGVSSCEDNNEVKALSRPVASVISSC